MNRCRNVAVEEAKSVVTIYRLSLVCKAEAVQGAVQPVSRSVSREDSHRAIASVRGGGKSHDQ